LRPAPLAAFSLFDRKTLGQIKMLPFRRLIR